MGRGLSVHMGYGVFFADPKDYDRNSELNEIGERLHNFIQELPWEEEKQLAVTDLYFGQEDYFDYAIVAKESEITIYDTAKVLQLPIPGNLDPKYRSLVEEFLKTQDVDFTGLQFGWVVGPLYF